jgi:hypothetical protein
MVYGIIHTSPQWGPIKNPITPTPELLSILIVSFHLRLMYSICSYPFKLKLCVISVIYAACIAPEILDKISIVLLIKGGIL